MRESQIDIADMQCWIFRMAEKKWKLSTESCIKIFKDYDIFGFIERCYGSLHLNSYECALSDIEKMLDNKGATIC